MSDLNVKLQTLITEAVNARSAYLEAPRETEQEFNAQINYDLADSALLDFIFSFRAVLKVLSPDEYYGPIIKASKEKDT